jgi:hypothetical protein
MDMLEWSKKKRRSGSRRSTGSRTGTTDQELLVYHRRSLQEREEAATRNRAYREGLAVDALLELEVNEDCRYVSPAEVVPAIFATSSSEVKASLIVCKIKRAVRRWFPGMLKKKVQQ